MNTIFFRRDATVIKGLKTPRSSAKFSGTDIQDNSESLISPNDVKNRKIKKSKSTSKSKPNHYVADVQAASVADPIPADGGSSTILHRTTLTVTPTFNVPLTVLENSTETGVNTAKVTGDRRLTTTIWIYPSSSVTEEQSSTLQNYLSKTSGASEHSAFVNSTHIPIFVLVLIGIGGFCLLIAALLVFRCVLRQHDQPDRPRPSAPILQDSPLFGGKERLSRGLWSNPSFGNLLTTHTKNGNGSWKNDGWRPLGGGRDVGGNDNCGLKSSQGNKEPPMQEQNKRQSVFLSPNVALSKDPDRLPPSPVSPSSVYTQAIPVGVALDYDFPIPPVSTMPLNVKSKKDNKKARYSVQTASLSCPISSLIYTQTESAMAYQDPRPAPTPGERLKAEGKVTNSNTNPSSRRNVSAQKSKASLQRSASASRRERDELFPHAIPTIKSKAHRDRDTKALTTALGLTSPSNTPRPPPSSCFSPVSIYPDDSLSVAHGKRRPMSEDQPLSEMPSPTGTHAALGDLMLQEFPSTATFASMRVVDPFADDYTVHAHGTQSDIKKSGSGSMRRRSSDRPPRVPSPPPLPSLSQMALASVEPDYRSPTYSIYGLYEAQRKSKASLS